MHIFSVFENARPLPNYVKLLSWEDQGAEEHGLSISLGMAAARTSQTKVCSFVYTLCLFKTTNFVNKARVAKSFNRIGCESRKYRKTVRGILFCERLLLKCVLKKDKYLKFLDLCFTSHRLETLGKTGPAI